MGFTRVLLSFRRDRFFGESTGETHITGQDRPKFTTEQREGRDTQHEIGRKFRHIHASSPFREGLHATVAGEVVELFARLTRDCRRDTYGEDSHRDGREGQSGRDAQGEGAELA